MMQVGGAGGLDSGYGGGTLGGEATGLGNEKSEGDVSTFHSWLAGSVHIMKNQEQAVGEIVWAI